ncbi:MAG TPA: restriction endonuclease subunit S [Verrucomicrobia bacterium]|nr:restriction endonuclease subunit S [Verrucomicrobiota bacterium]
MKKSKRALTPKLRFPEFRDSPGWKERPLSEVLSEHGLKSTGSEQVFSVSVHKGLVNQIKHLGRSFSASSTDHYNRVLPGDVVYTKSPTGNFPLGIVKQSKLEFPVIVSPLYGVFSPETTGLGVILDAYFESPANAKTFLDPLVQKGAKNTINIKNNRFLSGTLILPVNKEEQCKIGDFLHSLDGLIAAEGRKLAALRDHKRGLMQQLFPQPGQTQTQPRLRFPEFRGKGEWSEKTLGDICEVLMCKRIFASETSPNGEVPFYKIGTLGGVPDAFISKNLFEEYKLKYSFPRVGEVLITCSGTIGKCLPYDGSKAYFQDSNIVWIDNPTLEVSNEFLLSILSNVNWSRLNSTTITRIYGPDLRGLPIKFPQNEKEQQRITDCLSALDTRITAQTAKIETLKQHKRGLMQQLFPAPEER